MADRNDLRYGVFLVPDARTSAAVTDITGYVRAQFGLVSAQRFPPHVTLAGSLALAVDEVELLAVVQEVATRHRPVRLVNRGVQRLGASAVVFDVDTVEQDEPNVSLADLAADVGTAVRPLLRPTDELAADVHDRQSWHAHLSLASHELGRRADLRDEVEEFVRQLAVPYPESFLATRLAVYRLQHPTWSTGWWTSFEWEHVRTFHLGGQP